MDLADRASDLAYKKRRRRPARVRTPEGVAKYGQSIGTIIRRDLIERARAMFTPSKPSRISETATATKPQRPKKKYIVGGHEGWTDNWTEGDAGLYYNDPRPSYFRTHREGVKLKIQPAAGDKWKWTVESQIRAEQGRGPKSGLTRTLEAAMAEAEMSALGLLAERTSPLFSDRDIDALSHMSGVTFKRVGRTAIEQDYGNYRLGIEYDTKWGGGYQGYLEIGGSKRYLSTSTLLPREKVYQADNDLESMRKAFRQNPDIPRYMQRRKVHDSWHNYNYGIRGVDWYEDGDWEPNTTESRRLLALKDSSDLGIKVADGVPVNIRELINNVVWSYETMYPGFARLFNEFIMDDKYATNKGKEGTLAYNRNDGYYNDTVRSTIGIISQQWDKPDSELEKKSTHGIDGSSHFHTSRPEGHPEGYKDWEYAFLDTLHHEFGHTVHAALYNSMNRSRFNAVLQELARLGILEGDYKDKYDAYYAAVTINPAATSLLVSGYGQTNLNELLAEIWTEYVSDPHPREGIAAIGEILEEALTRYLNATSGRLR